MSEASSPEQVETGWSETPSTWEEMEADFSELLADEPTTSQSDPEALTELPGDSAWTTAEPGEISWAQAPPSDQELGWGDWAATGPQAPETWDGNHSEPSPTAEKTEWGSPVASGWEDDWAATGPQAPETWDGNHSEPSPTAEKPDWETPVASSSQDPQNLEKETDSGKSLPPDLWAKTETDISQLLNLPYKFVNSEAMVVAMLDDLSISHSEIPLLSIDIEGLNLGKKDGQTYLMQIYDSQSHRVYNVDIYTLGRAAFTTPASNGEINLEMVLESAEILKLFCDVRGDSYALFSEFGIRLQGIQDVQNVQVASRPTARSRRWRPSLDRLILDHARLPYAEQKAAEGYKKAGKDLCRGFGYEQFSVRPLRGDLAVYAANDVLYLGNIRNNLVASMTEERLTSADIQTERSILRTHQPDYNPNNTGNSAAVGWFCKYEDDEWDSDDDYY